MVGAAKRSGLLQQNRVLCPPKRNWSADWRKWIPNHEFGHCVWIDHGRGDPGAFRTPHSDPCLMKLEGFKADKSFCDQKCKVETKVRP